MKQVIPPSQIESELVKIWDSLQIANKMRACLFNLVIYTRKGKRSEYLSNVAKQIIKKFPSRILFISIDDTKPKDYLETSVSVMTAEEGDCEIVCDFVEIDLGLDQKVQAPFLVLPHILPDLPIYIVWADDPTKEDPISYKLEKFATRVIYDSEASDNLVSFSDIALKHKETSHTDIADLNWARIQGFRDLFASTFHTPDKLKTLQSANDIKIVYNRMETSYLCHTKVQSIYLQGWLATRLGWKLKSISTKDKNLIFQYDNHGKDLSVTLIPSTLDGLSPGRIIGIEISSETNEKIEFIRKKDLPHHVIITKTTDTTCELPVHFIFAQDETGLSLVNEICHNGTSSHFTDLLDYLSKLNPKDICS